MNSKVAAEQKPEFFKVLMPQSLCKLKIPPLFKKYIIDESARNSTLVIPLGKTWQVAVRVEGRDAYFVEGWEKFVQDNELRLGHFIVFRYKGDMVFKVKIFDETCCLRRQTQVPLVSTNKQKRLRLRGRERNSPIVILDDSRLPPHDLRALSLHQQTKRFKTYEFDREKPHCLIKTLHSYHFDYRCMDLPNEFCRRNSLLTNCEVTLRDSRRRLWQVRFCTGSKFRLSKGWTEFIVGNNMKEGQSIIFEFLSKENRLFDVKVLPN